MIGKFDLIGKLAERRKLTTEQATQAFTSIFDEIEKALINGNSVEIRGFGTFFVKHYKGYKGTNPRNGETIYIEPKKRPVFKPGKIKKSLNTFS